MLTTIQIILLVFITFFLSRVYLRSKEKVIPVKTAFFWTLIWVFALVGIILPATTSKIASFFGVGRGVDVILYLGMSVLFYLVFRIYVMIEDLRRELTKIVRNVGIQNAVDPKKVSRVPRKKRK